MLNPDLPLHDIFRFRSVEEQYVQGCVEGGMMDGGLCKSPIQESGANDLGLSRLLLIELLLQLYNRLPKLTYML